MREKHVNLIAYDDVENLNRFDDITFKTYCDAKINSCDKHIDFIKNNCIDENNWTGRILEVGSGNSKLLYRMEREGLLAAGYGFEISASRYQFAEKFKKYVNSRRVKNINDNILTNGQMDRWI
jgi:hypothetical protein